MIHKGVFILQTIKHIYPLREQALALQITVVPDRCIYVIYSRRYFLNSLKFMPVLKVLIKRKSGKAKG